MAASAGIVTTMAGAHGGSPALIHACVHKVSYSDGTNVDLKVARLVLAE